MEVKIKDISDYMPKWDLYHRNRTPEDMLAYRRASDDLNSYLSFALGVSYGMIDRDMSLNDVAQAYWEVMDKAINKHLEIGAGDSEVLNQVADTLAKFVADCGYENIISDRFGKTLSGNKIEEVSSFKM